MPIKKGVKISATKRGHHERAKKNFAKSKKTVHREKQIRQNIFKKSKTAQKKEDFSAKKPDKSSDDQNKKRKLKNHSNSKDAKKFPEAPSRDVIAEDYEDMINSSDSEDDDQIEVEVPVKRPRLDSVDSQSAQSAEESDIEFESDAPESGEEESDEEANEDRMKGHERGQRRAGAAEAEVAARLKEMLPIKTKTGVVPRLVEDLRERNEDVDDTQQDSDDDDDNDELALDEDTDEDILQSEKQENEQNKKPDKLSAAELLMEREQELQKQKFRIGVICSALLEKPEEKVKNLGALLDLMAEYTPSRESNMLSVRKLAMISLVEVFKDINPDYKLGVVDLEHQKVKKDTLARVAYENELLKYYKLYLRELEEVTKALKPRKYEARPSRERVELAEVAVHCLCESLITSPYFNFSTNIAQLLVSLLNCRNQNVRKKAHACFTKIFRTDKRLDLTLHIVRNVNQLVKRKSNFVCVEVISNLISLPIKNINVNAEKEAELKQKKLEQRKSRLINMSKRERKRKKKLVELEKELMETQAEENKQTKNAKLTDISKLVFTIYFRILKQNPNSRLLSVTLEGLAKFAHIINIEFFSDLIEVLNHLVEKVELGYREQLHCIQTVFTILSGQGEVLNIDPARFYTHLYKNMLRVNAGKSHVDIESVISTVENVLLKRRKNITHLRYLAFLKRLMTLSLQVQLHGSLGCLSIVRSALQLNTKLDVLLDPENKVGSGKFDPEIIEPEFSNANGTSLFELTLLRRHYHPTVVKFANNIVDNGQHHQLDPALTKLSPLDLMAQFDSTKMSFNPPIPQPAKRIKEKS